MCIFFHKKWWMSDSSPHLWKSSKGKCVKRSIKLTCPQNGFSPCTISNNSTIFTVDFCWWHSNESNLDILDSKIIIIPPYCAKIYPQHYLRWCIIGGLMGRDLTCPISTRAVTSAMGQQRGVIPQLSISMLSSIIISTGRWLPSPPPSIATTMPIPPSNQLHPISNHDPLNQPIPTSELAPIK